MTCSLEIPAKFAEKKLRLAVELHRKADQARHFLRHDLYDIRHLRKARRHNLVSMSGEEGEAGEEGSMRIDPARAKLLVENLQHVAQRVDAVRGSRKVKSIYS